MTALRHHSSPCSAAACGRANAMKTAAAASASAAGENRNSLQLLRDERESLDRNSSAALGAQRCAVKYDGQLVELLEGRRRGQFVRQHFRKAPVIAVTAPGRRGRDILITER